MRTAESYANKMTWCFSHDSPAYHEMKKLINEAREDLLSELANKTYIADDNHNPIITKNDIRSIIKELE